MKANEFILEYKTVQSVKAPGKNQFVFQTDKGMMYTISLKRDFDMKHNSRLVISFTTIDPTTGKETNGRTNTGDAISIFRTVQSTLLDYLKSLPQDQLPDMLEFSADPNDIQRVSLYKAISHSNKIPGYEFKSQEPFGYGGRVDFTMKRTKQVTEGAAGWKVIKEIPGGKRVSTIDINGTEITKLEVWNVGRTGKTMLGSNAIGSWKTRGYKANGKFFHSYRDAVAVAKQPVTEDDDQPTQIKLDSRAKALAWINEVYDLYPQTWQNNHVMPLGGTGDDQQFAMFELIPSMSQRDAVEVKWFQAYPLRQGVGTRAMRELQRLAQEDGIALTLFPWDKGQVSQAKLTKFYRGAGFKPAVKGSKALAWSPEPVAEGLQNIEIQDDKSIVTISVGGKERFLLQPATGDNPKSYGGGTYKYWTIWDLERKKYRFNPNIGMPSKNQAIAYVNKIIKREEDAGGQ